MARSSPLYAQGYFARGVAFQREGDVLASKSIIEHSLRLDPRMAEARLWMAIRHFEDGQPSQAIGHLLLVHRLRRNLAHELAAIIAEAAKDRRTRLVISERLRDTRLILEILRYASADLDAASLREIIGSTDLDRLDSGVKLAQQAMIRSSIERDDYITAYAHWRTLLGDRGPETPVFNGDFEDTDASPPFNWTITGGADVSSRRLRLNIGGHVTGMELKSFSASSVTLAEQTILLRPGSHVLRAWMRSDTRDKPTFGWRVQCRTGLVIVDAAILASQSWQSYDVVFEVPRNCWHQEVQIFSQGAGDAEGDWLQITGVTIDPVD